MATTITNIIYKIKNEQRKCFYIGYTCRGLNIRKSQHYHDCFKKISKIKLYNFIKKYGWDSFIWEILAVYSTPEELPPAEIDWLKQQKEEFSDWECLNSTEAGAGVFGYKHTNLEIEKIKQNTPKYWLGKSFSNTHVEKLRQSHKGKINTEVSNKKRKNTMMEYWKTHIHPSKGKPGPNLGKKFSEESKEKMSQAQKGLRMGEKNGYSKKVLLVSPMGEKFKLMSYKQFCKHHELQNSNICHLLHGRIKTHKGWTGKYLEE